MKQQSIGIIDSGLGGFTYYHALTKAYPKASFTLLVDQKNAPFGDKNQDELLAIAKKLIDYFCEQKIETVLIACNTLSATVLKDLKQLYPQINFINVIDLTVSQVPKEANRILVLATQATVKKLSYSKALTKKFKDSWVNEIAAPKLVPLIEGLADDEDIDEELQLILNKKSKVDTIVLGCTHYPLIKENISKLTKATIVDGLNGAIDYFKEISLPEGLSTIYTTLDAHRLANQVKSLYQEDVEVREIKL